MIFLDIASTWFLIVSSFMSSSACYFFNKSFYSYMIFMSSLLYSGSLFTVSFFSGFDASWTFGCASWTFGYGIFTGSGCFTVCISSCVSSLSSYSTTFFRGVLYWSIKRSIGFIFYIYKKIMFFPRFIFWSKSWPVWLCILYSKLKLFSYVSVISWFYNLNRFVVVCREWELYIVVIYDFSLRIIVAKHWTLTMFWVVL